MDEAKSNIWDRLRFMNISFIQRQLEHYRIILIWKILEGLLSLQGGLKGMWWQYKGREVIILAVKSKGKVIMLKQMGL